MAQGRSSAHGNSLAAAAVLCLLVAHVGYVHATTHTVGESHGWTFKVNNWPKTKCFKVNDTLVFNYKAGMHNVVRVDRAGYKSCTAPEGATAYTSGHDEVKLERGGNFFICTKPGHCQAGVKIGLQAITGGY